MVSAIVLTQHSTAKWIRTQWPRVNFREDIWGFICGELTHLLLPGISNVVLSGVYPRFSGPKMVRAEMPMAGMTVPSTQLLQASSRLT